LLPKSDDLSEIARAVAEAHVYIALDASAAVFGMFARGAIVEIPPAGMECVTFGSPWAQVNGALYVPLSSNPECECESTNITCYLAAYPVWNKVHETDLKLAMEFALEQSRAKIL
jgi:hypothetical protein